MAQKMTLALFSGSVDKLTCAGVILSGAAADDMDIDVFVLLQGAHAFKKENAGAKGTMAEMAHKEEEFRASLVRLQVKPWMEMFREAKEMTNMKIHVCGLAGKIWGGVTLEDFNDLADDICGIGEYITSAQQADVHLFI